MPKHAKDPEKVEEDSMELADEFDILWSESWARAETKKEERK